MRYKADQYLVCLASLADILNNFLTNLLETMYSISELKVLKISARKVNQVTAINFSSIFSFPYSHPFGLLWKLYFSVNTFFLKRRK